MLILLVDDHEDSRRVVGAMLEKLGNEVIEAPGGKEALQLALRHHPDVILMDLSMPEVDGLLATAAIRTISSFVRVPIVAITAYPRNLTFADAMAAGCDAYLRKPVTLDDLSSVLKKFQQGVA